MSAGRRRAAISRATGAAGRLGHRTTKNTTGPADLNGRHHGRLPGPDWRRPIGRAKRPEARYAPIRGR
ncbi:hypothetical protein FRAHR75_40117 [Frankia sp. Hr75.2]|nr:hypothetical protein FRAHR75_40117 [Frankia sp. Hr75.2]SQD99250.1 hypothetical protein FMEAI12_5150054 [Parafrankia sp. Ea1.12]